MEIMNLSGLLDSAVAILRKYCRSFILFNLGYWAVAFILLFVLFIVAALGVAGSVVFADENPVIIVGFMALIVMATMVLGLCNGVGAIHLAAQEVLLSPVDAAKAIGSSLKSIFRMTGLALLGLLPLFPLGYLGWRLLGDPMVQMVSHSSEEMVTALGSIDQRILLTVLGFLLVVLVLLLLLNAYLTLFTYALQAMVLENKGPVAAIRRSIQLVRGRFWYLYGAISLVSLVMYGINLSLDSFFLMLSGLAELGLYFLGVEPGTGFNIIYLYGRGIASILYTLLFNSLGAVILTQLYYNRVYETEGYDLLLRISRLPAAEDRQESP